MSTQIKFQRAYIMTVEGNTGEILTITSPITLEFNITHNIYAATNVADFTLYNLNANKRRQIAFNQFLKSRAYKVTLRAGYISQLPLGVSPLVIGSLSDLPLIFDGHANVAFTERRGPDLVTQINAFDFGDITSGSAASVFPAGTPPIPAGTSFDQRVKTVMKYLSSNITPGTVNVFPVPPSLTKPEALTGTVWNKLLALGDEAAGAHVFVENGVVNMLGQNASDGFNNLGTLTSSTGLLGVPKYTSYNILCSCVFEPSLAIGKTIDLESTFNPDVNGTCKIVAYSHHGTISGVESGEATSDITLLKVTTPLGVAS